MEQFAIDVEVLKEFERTLDPRHPERGKIPVRVLGYGEISTVFEIQVEGLRELAFKRLPLFQDKKEMESYRRIFEEYSRVLVEEVGLKLVHQGFVTFTSDEGRPLFYIAQKQLPSSSIGNHVIHLLPALHICELVRSVLKELCKVWEFNRRQSKIQVGIDGQISNWAIEGFDATNPAFSGSTPLLYMDTSTPLFRVQGREQINPDLFLRSAASFLVWMLRRFFLQDVIDRYYDLHLVCVDLIANFYKEQGSKCIPDLIQEANYFFANNAPHLGVESLSEREVRSYYREDALIWTLYLFSRKLDRFLRTTLLGREYPYILPGKIKR